jgi:hypothetical protein
MSSTTQNVTTETVVISKKENNTLLSFNVKRTAGGVDIYLQSDVMELFFSNGGFREGADPLWGGIGCYSMINNIDTTKRSLLNNWGSDNLIVSSEYPNLAFLRAKGLKDGVTFKLPSVHSRTEIAKFVKLFKEQVRTLYLEYMKPIGVEIEMTTTTTNGVDA